MKTILTILGGAALLYGALLGLLCRRYGDWPEDDFSEEWQA